MLIICREKRFFESQRRYRWICQRDHRARERQARARLWALGCGNGCSAGTWLDSCNAVPDWTLDGLWINRSYRCKVRSASALFRQCILRDVVHSARKCGHSRRPRITLFVAQEKNAPKLLRRRIHPQHVGHFHEYPWLRIIHARQQRSCHSHRSPSNSSIFRFMVP